MTMMTTADFGSALDSAIQNGYLGQLQGGTYAVSSPIVIHVTRTTQGALGIDGGGATLVSQVTNGQPLIQIVVDPGVDLRYLTLSNFKIEGNGHEGDGIQIVANGNDRWVYNWNISNVTVEHVGGYGLDMQGSIFEGLLSDSWMNGNGQGGARFAHNPGGGQVSALRWFGGGADNNGGAGITLDNGARDLSVDGATFANNGGVGISAGSGITSVSRSQFIDNQGMGVWFQNYGNFNDNVFSTAGVQATGISGYLAGNATIIGSTSTYTGSGTDTTMLANLQGNGGAFLTGDVGNIVAGSGVAASGVGDGDLADVSVSTQGVALPTLSPITAATTAATASSSTGTLGKTLKAALSGGYVAHLTGASAYTVTSPIVINVTSSMQGGIDLGGAKICSQITNGSPVIRINVASGVDISRLTLSNFSILGNGAEGDGIKIVANGINRSITLDISNVNVEHVGGIGLDVIGNITGGVFDSWMHGNAQGGARFANSAGGGLASGLAWTGGGFRKNAVAGLILDNGAHDMTVKGAYFVDNSGPGLAATSGITLVEESGFENNQGIGALVQGNATFIDDTFSTWGTQQAGVGGYLPGGQIVMTGNGSEYYGGGSDTTVLANVQGTGTLAIAGGGDVVAGPNVTVSGGIAGLPTVTSIWASGAAINLGTGDLRANRIVTLTVAFSEAVTVAGGTPTLLLNDGGIATHSSGSGSSSLTFSYTVRAGQNVADLAVSSLSLNGATIKDAAGNAANLAGATNYNPFGTLQVDTIAPTISSIVASGSGLSAGGGTVGVGSVVIFTVDMSEMVKVKGTPSLSLSDGGIATYTGGSGTSSLVFSYVVAPGESTPDLTITGLNLNGGSIVDGAGNAANLTAAAGYNPVGTLIVDGMPIVTAQLESDTGVSSTDGITASAALIGTADPNAVVHFAVDGTAIAAAATADAGGIWSFTPTGLADGSHTIVVSETASGLTGTQSLVFMLDTQAPVPTFTGAVQSSGYVTLSGTAGEAAATISIYDGSSLLGSTTTATDGSFRFTAAAATNVAHRYSTNATDLPGNESSGRNNLILGSSGANTLVGLGVDDVIVGAGGADTLTGGAGAVTFAYQGAAQSSPTRPDTITDFQHAADTIDFARIGGIAASGGVPRVQGNITGNGDLTLNPHSVAYLEAGGNTHVLVNTTAYAEVLTTTNTQAANMEIVLVGTGLGLTASDFHHT